MSNRIPTLLSVVVPCFNEQEVLELTHRRLIEALGDSISFDLEIVYVNDGSRDRTEEILFDLAEAESRVKVISLSRNFGHQPAITAGLDYAAGNIVAVIDADLQDPPELIVSMVTKWREGFDVVYGVRTKRKEGLLKRLSYNVFYRLYRYFARVEIPLDSGDFALLDRRVVDLLNSLPERNRFIRGLRAWTGFRQAGLVYERGARAAGDAKYNFRKLFKLAFDGIFNFSTAPLTIIFITGLITSLMSVLATLVYLIARIGDYKIFGYSPGDARGFTTLILAILFFSGIQLISLGIIGEYLGRLYQESKMRPIYVVKEVRGEKYAASIQAQNRLHAADEPQYDSSTKPTGS
ncbi:MAG: glycosyltransferase family 2 protein [Desulfobacterales bacterium]|jgi:dolichol-phosphate mannosyltransferase